MRTVLAITRLATKYLVAFALSMPRKLSCFLLTLIAVSALFATTAAPAYALSNACIKVNVDWGAQGTFSHSSGESYRQIPYSSFSIGETLSWTVSSSGNPGASPLKSNFAIFDDDINEYAYEESTNGVNFNESGIYVINGAEAGGRLTIEVFVPVSQSSITYQIVCSDGSAPTVTSVSPASGSIDGGTSVAIEGTGFVNVSEVKFGSTSAASYTVVSPTKITAVAPANAAGPVAVSVTQGSTPASQTQTFTYIAPPVISPVAGALPAGIVGITYTGTTFSATSGVAPYSFAVAGGDTLPAGLTLNSGSGAITGSPTTAGNFSFTVVVTDANGLTGSAAYTLGIDELPVAGAVAATVAANSSTNPITLSLSGGTATSVSISSIPGNGTATASGTSITYTPNAGYSGADSFNYTATNAAGTSTPATVTLTVTAPTFSFLPVAGALTDGAVNAAYSGVTIVASNGSGTYTFAVTSGSLPTGLSLNSGTGAISGTPTTAGNASFTIRATDGNNATGLVSYTLAIAEQPPVTGAVSETVAANSSANPITLNLSGGTATSVSISSIPGNGTATASGTSITYTPNAGYSGSDSFNYTATNSGGTSAPATVTITVSSPTFAFSPTAGALTGGTENVAYSGSVISVSNGAAPYAFALASGPLPDGLSIDPGTGAIAGSPTTAGNYTFTIAATDNNNVTGSVSYTLVIVAQPPVTGAVSETVAANSSANPITLNLSGGTATSVSISSAAGNGTATASGTSITYTPNAGYSGADTFTYTATNSGGTSAPATVTMTVTAPTLAFSPTAGALTDGNEAVAYPGVTIVASNGATPYTFAMKVGSLPAGLSLGITTGAISGTPTTAGSSSFIIEATDSNNVTGSVSYTLEITEQPPVTGAVMATVAANSSANPITLSLSGGAATSVSISSAAGNGTATASGTSITYTPNAGYSGADSFSYTATNSGGTSASAMVTITVSSPIFSFSPTAGALTGGTENTTYSSAAISVSNGTSPYVFALASGPLPDGLSLDAGTGAITGTPTTSGNYAFTIDVTDANNATGQVSYTLAIAVAPPVSFSFSPATGALPEAMADEPYDQQITASGGAAPLTYSLASGALPDGLTLSTSGEVSGTLADNTQGDYSFTVEVRDANSATATASYTLRVVEHTVTVVNQTIVVPPGSSPPDARLDRNATGGPFDSASLVSVQPTNAGTATITMGDFAQVGPVSPVGWYLKFTPASGYSGTVVITFSLTSGIGSSTGTVTYTLGYDPADVATEIDSLVHGFVKSRQNLIASTLSVPGLLERRKMESAAGPVNTIFRPSARGVTLGFSTSLAQLGAARDGADGVTSGSDLIPFNVWVDGSFLMHNREQNDSKWGSFAMLNLGMDYLVTDKALVGLSFHYDRMTDPTKEDAELTGNGWLAGPYASFEVGKGVFWDASLLYGGSANDIDTRFWDGTFDTTRWIVDTALKGQWNLDDVTVLTPKLRAIYFSETVDRYTVTNDLGDELTIDGFTTEQFRVSLGAEIARQFTLENGSQLVPKLGASGGFSGLDGSGAFGTLSAGLALETIDQWNIDFSLLYNIDGDGEKAAGAKAGVSKRF